MRSVALGLGCALAACSLVNAPDDPVCEDCAPSECATGFADCDGVADNGCETPIDTLSDCGACGVVCAPANVATANCENRICGYDVCVGDFQECDGVADNGCESDRRSDADNCGECGTGCMTGEACVDGQCEVPIFLSCADALEKGQTMSGVYTLEPTPGAAFDAYCDMTTKGGGWTECFNVVNTTAEELDCTAAANFFDRCVDFTMAEWSGDEVLLTLTDASEQIVYSAAGTRALPWTYELLTSPNPPMCPNPSDQYDRSVMHPNAIVLDNGEFLTITGKSAGQNGWGGSWGNGYTIVTQTAPAYAANNVVAVMTHLHSSCYSNCTPRAFMGMTAGHEVMYGPGGTVTTFNDAALQPSQAFLGTFRFLVR